MEAAELLVIGVDAPASEVPVRAIQIGDSI
jgi:hypothetical protein